MLVKDVVLQMIGITSIAEAVLTIQTAKKHLIIPPQYTTKGQKHLITLL